MSRPVCLLHVGQNSGGVIVPFSTYNTAMGKRFFVFVASVLVLTACARPGPPSPTVPPLRTLPFVASSRPITHNGVTGDFAVAGELSGTAMITQDRIDIEVARGVVRQNAARQSDLRLAVGLAFGDVNGKWDIRRMSRDVPLRGQLPSSGTGPIADTLRFTIPVPRGTNLAQHWLVFRFEWPQSDAQQSYRASAYAHTELDVFVQP